MVLNHAKDLTTATSVVSNFVSRTHAVEFNIFLQTKNIDLRDFNIANIISEITTFGM